MDLAEFIGGVADVLRGLLMLQVGAEPEGLTEALRATLQRYRDRLDAGDVLRMLRLLADNETGIRRSVSPRLVVETLLLRWAMMDRTVDLEEVIQAGKLGTYAGKRGSGEVKQEAPTGQGIPAPAPSAPKGSPTRPEAPGVHPGSSPLGPPRVPASPPPRLPSQLHVSTVERRAVNGVHNLVEDKVLLKRGHLRFSRDRRLEVSPFRAIRRGECILPAHRPGG